MRFRGTNQVVGQQELTYPPMIECLENTMTAINQQPPLPGPQQQTPKLHRQPSQLHIIINTLPSIRKGCS